MTNRVLFTVLAVPLLCLGSFVKQPRADDRGQKASNLTAYVMDISLRMAQSVSLADGSVLKSPKFEAAPAAMVLSPDQSRLLVFHRPASYAKLPHAGFFQPKHPQKLSILDAHDMRIIADIDSFGWNAAPIRAFTDFYGSVYGQWDSSGKRLTVLCWGRPDHDPELVQVDISDAKIVGRYTLSSDTAGLVAPIPIIPGEKAALLFRKKGSKTKDKDKKPGDEDLSLVLINLRDITDCKEISLKGNLGSAAVSPDGSYIYVFAGSFRNNFTEVLGTYIHIVSLKNNLLEQTIDTGTGVTQPYVDRERGRVIFAADETKNAKPRLMVMQGNEKSREVELPDSPFLIVPAPRTKRLYAICYNSIQVLDLEALNILNSIATLRSQNVPRELVFDVQEKRGFLSYAGDDRITLLDLQGFKMSGSIDIESAWKNFGNIALNLASAAIVGGVVGAILNWPEQPRISTMRVDTSDRFLYVPSSKDIYFIDLATNKKTGSLSLESLRPSYCRFLPNGFLEVVGIRGTLMRPGIVLVNTETNTKAIDQNWYGSCAYSADGSTAVNFDSKRLYCIDPKTMSITKTIEGFKELRQLILAESTN